MEDEMSKKPSPKKPTAKKSPTPAKAPPARVGVIDEIVSVLEKGGGTVAEIVAKLSKKFPDRDADRLMATVRTQMSRLKTTRNLKIKASDTSPVTYSVYRTNRDDIGAPWGPFSCALRTVAGGL
jgi:hypothetical protein